MKIIKEGHIDVPDYSWCYELENECEACGARWMIEESDEMFGWASGPLAVSLNKRSLTLGKNGSFYPALTRDGSEAHMYSWCPTCGNRTRTDRGEDASS